LNPIKIFGGSFGGPTLYENPFYISPNQVFIDVPCWPSVFEPFSFLNFYKFFLFWCFQIRALEKRKKAGKYAKKVKAKTRRKMHELSNPLEPDEFADMWKE